MWNAQTSGLLNGTTCVIYDGNPGGSKDKPGLDHALALRRRGRRDLLRRRRGVLRQLPQGRVDLATAATSPAVRALGTTGSPLSEDAQRWGTEQFRRAFETPQAGSAPSGRTRAAERGGEIWWCNISGGTDFAGAFIGGNRELPQTPGRMQCRLLGCAVEAWNEKGCSL
jgi:acetoacetyl-CoA synthetase